MIVGPPLYTLSLLHTHTRFVLAKSLYSAVYTYICALGVHWQVAHDVAAAAADAARARLLAIVVTLYNECIYLFSKWTSGKKGHIVAASAIEPKRGHTYISQGGPAAQREMTSTSAARAVMSRRYTHRRRMRFRDSIFAGCTRTQGSDIPDPRNIPLGCWIYKRERRVPLLSLGTLECSTAHTIESVRAQQQLAAPYVMKAEGFWRLSRRLSLYGKTRFLPRLFIGDTGAGGGAPNSPEFPEDVRERYIRTYIQQRELNEDLRWWTIRVVAFFLSPPRVHLVLAAYIFIRIYIYECYLSSTTAHTHNPHADASLVAPTRAENSRTYVILENIPRGWEGGEGAYRVSRLILLSRL